VKQDIQVEVLNLQAEFCKALSDPKRLYIIKELRGGERTVNELADILGITQSNTSQQLAILRRIGVISPRKDGTTVYYRLADQKIAEACDLVQQVIAEQLQSQQLLSRLM
jgi:ArsR family transcriptional regulator, virulence genes transcriptional regulator